jgi:hypothetical protein
VKYAAVVSTVFLSLVLHIACDRTITSTTYAEEHSNCFGCHNDDNTKLVAARQQWVYSIHAIGANIDRRDQPCAACHTSEGFTANLAGSPQSASVAQATAIHCYTCHAPHSDGDLELRVEGGTELENGVMVNMGGGDICASCHRAVHNVDTYVSTPNDTVVFDSDHWGPHHGSQSDMLIGSNGYEHHPFFSREGPHLEAAVNGCLDCHFEVTRNYRLGGHSFNMSWGFGDDEELNTDACNQDACHGKFNDGNLSDFNHHDIQSDVDALLATLKTLLIDANLIDDSNHTIPGRVVASADTAGAVWNYLMALQDGSRGVHNPEYIPNILGTSIVFMGGTPPILSRPMRAPVSRSHLPTLPHENYR